MALCIRHVTVQCIYCHTIRFVHHVLFIELTSHSYLYVYGHMAVEKIMSNCDTRYYLFLVIVQECIP